MKINPIYPNNPILGTTNISYAVGYNRPIPINICPSVTGIMIPVNFGNDVRKLITTLPPEPTSIFMANNIFTMVPITAIAFMLTSLSPVLNTLSPANSANINTSPMNPTITPAVIGNMKSGLTTK